MHAFYLLPLLACIASATFGLTLVMRFPNDRTARVGAGLGAAASAWALSEVGVLVAPGSAVAEGIFTALAPGWIFITPLAYHMAVTLGDGRNAQRPRALALAYLVGTIFYITQLTHGWLISGTQPTPWGLYVTTGPGFPFFACYTLCCSTTAVFRFARYLRRAPSFAQTPVNLLISVAIGTPAVIATLTEIALPLSGISFPHLGATSFGVMAAIALWTNIRAGYVVTSPAVYADQILRVMTDGVALLTVDGEIRLANQGLGRLTGVSPLDLVGRRLESFLPGPTDEGSEPRRRAERELVGQDGGRVPVSLVSSPLLDYRGSRVGDVVVVHDVREVATLRNRLLLSARLAAVGELAAGIAHEINNPIAFVRSNLGLLHEHWQQIAKEQGLDAPSHPLHELVQEGHDMLCESLEGIDRAASIVRDVQDFSHSGAGERQLVDVHVLLDRVVRVTRPQIGPLVALERDYAGEGLVSVSPQRLVQVFLNLLVNAIHAVGEQGTIWIDTYREEGELVVRIRDDGCGISPEHLERVFDPFFTTKPVGEGTGLGLSISYEIIRSEGGELEVESVEGRGTTLCVRLPRADAGANPAS